MTMKSRVLLLALIAAILAVSAVVVFFYTTQLSLSLKGESKITINLCGFYEDPGVNAKMHGKDASDKVKVTGDVDTAAPGTYKIKYKLDDLEVTRTVTVLEKMNPVIVLEDLGEGEDQYRLGDKFKEPGYSAEDENGNDITDNVEVTGADLTKAGDHKIEYTVSDDQGNTTRVARDVYVEANTDYETPGIAICMYHYVYDVDDPPKDLDSRYGNYISTDALSEECGWLQDEGYYFPEWKEIRSYVDGELILPDKSIVLSFDDGAESFLEKGIPILEEYKVPATSFLITSKDGEKKVKKYKSKYITYESHSDNMHRAGGDIGHGGIFTAISYEAGIADLKRSIEICGNGDAFAYPYGDHNDSSEAMVEDAGFLCAVTTEYGKIKPGDDPYLLPRVRMNNGQTLDDFINKVAP